MKKIVYLALAVLALGACNLDFAGLEELDAASLALAEQGRVTSVLCAPNPAPAILGTLGECEAYNTYGTLLEYGGFPALAGGWISSDPKALLIALDGTFTILSTVPDTVTVYAVGTGNSLGSVDVIIN